MSCPVFGVDNRKQVIGLSSPVREPAVLPASAAVAARKPTGKSTRKSEARPTSSAPTARDRTPGKIRRCRQALDSPSRPASVLPVFCYKLYMDVGWGTYGFKAGPAGGRYMAEMIATRKTPPLIAPFAPSRFRENRQLGEKAAAAVSH